MLPAGLVGNLLVLHVAQPGDDHGFKPRPIQVAHQVPQADDGAAVADAVFHIQHPPFSVQQPRVNVLVLVGDDIDRVACQRHAPGVLAHACALVGQAALHRLGQVSHVVGRVGEAGFTFDDQFAAAAGPCRYARQAAGHGLQHHVRQAFLGRRQQQQIGTLVVRRHVGVKIVQREVQRMVARQLCQSGAKLALFIVSPLRTDSQQQCAGFETFVRHPLLGQPQDVLALVQYAHIQRNRLLGGQIQVGTLCPGLVGGHTAMALSIHAVGHVVDSGRAHATAQKLQGQFLADGDTGIHLAQHALVQPAHHRMLQALQVVMGQTGLDQ